MAILPEGGILANGRPEDVLESGLLAQAFNVDSRVIKADGLAHAVVVAQPRVAEKPKNHQEHRIP